jgi:CspA family cold shock protein
MAKQSQSAVCRRCGCGFMLTTAHRDFLARRGVNVKTPVLCMTCFLKNGPWPKQQGKVKWFNPGKRYGFIATGEGEEIFFHQQQLLAGEGNEPHEGQMALFHTRYTTKGPEALNVELVRG